MAEIPVPTPAVAEETNIDDNSISPFRKWGSLVVLSLALAIIIIDTTILNVSLSTIIKDLNTNIQSLQWVITAYALMLSAFTITGGRLGDIFGRKKMFMLGAAIFAAGSFITSISHTVPVMILGEAIIEGIGAAMMMPATASLVVSNFKGRERAIAFGIWGGIAAASAALGPILGGYLTTNYSWRWAFRINVFVAAVLLIGSIIIKESYDRKHKPSLDIFGMVLSSLGMLSIVFGIIEAETYGWLHSKAAFAIGRYIIDLGQWSIVPLFIILGFIFLYWFLLWERRVEDSGKTALVNLELFQNRQFVSGALTVAVLSLAMAGLTFTMPVFFQTVRNLDALHTGLAMLPLSLTMLVFGPLSAVTSKHIPIKYLIQFGLVMDFIGFWVLRGAMNVNATPGSFTLGYILFGIGMGSIMAQGSNITLSAVSVEEAGEASGVNNTLRQVGQTLGAAIIGAILLSVIGSNVTNSISSSQVIPAQAKAPIMQAVAAQANNIEFSGTGEVEQNLPENIKTEITSIVHQATVDGNKEALAYGSIFILLGLVVSFWLPNKKLH